MSMTGSVRVYFSTFLCLCILEVIIQCDASWFRRADNNHVYYFSDDRVRWTDANTECENRDAYLVTINGRNENEFLVDYYTGTPKHWIGLYCPDSNNCNHEGDLSWVAGYSDYFNWQGGYVIGNVRFAYIDFGEDGGWGPSDDRNELLRYICEKPDGCHNPSNPCENGGTCMPDNIGGYTCDCRNGFIGQNCQTVEHCSSGPCVRGTCSEGSDSFICDCGNSGYSGIVCDDDINECDDDTHNCVHDNGQCNNTIGSFRCDCYDGLIGNRCQNDFNECNSNPCTHGSCINGRNRYDCICPTTYTGINCESDIDECTQNAGICNNGTCQNTDGSFNCACHSGYRGSRCDRDINECETHICQNRATCVNTPGSYQCICRPGYMGQNCSIDIDECASDPCRNGGNCTDHINAYRCDCPPNFTGNDCDIDVDECHQTDACGEGNCTNTYGSFICECLTGYGGPQCADDIDECLDEEACSFHGQCFNTQGAFACSCELNFHGDRCLFEVQKQQATKSNYDRPKVKFGDNTAAICFMTTSLILLIGLLILLTFYVRKTQPCANSFHPNASSSEHANDENTFPKLCAEGSTDPKDVTLEFNSATYENVGISATPLYENVNESSMEASAYQQLGPMVVDEQPYELDPKSLYTSLQTTHVTPRG